VTSTAFSSHWHARLHLQGPGMLHLKVSIPCAILQLPKIFLFLISMPGEVVQNQNFLSTYFHVEKDA